MNEILKKVRTLNIDKFVLFTIFLFINYPIIQYIAYKLPILSNEFSLKMVQLFIYACLLLCYVLLAINNLKFLKKSLMIIFVLILLSFLVDNSFLLERINIIVRYMINCFMLFSVLYMYGNKDKVIVHFHRTIILNLLLCGLYYFLMRNNRVELAAQGQTLSYIISLYLIIAVYFVFREFTWKDFICIVLDLILIFQFGSRTILLVACLYFIFELIMFIYKFYCKANKENKKRILVSLFVIVVMIVLLLINMQNIAVCLYSYLNKHGVYNRFIRLLAEGGFLSTSSGRVDSFYSVIFEDILKHPFGKGLAYDRVVIYNTNVLNGGLANFEGCYSHNIILEYFSTFGIPIGLFLMVLGIKEFVKVFKESEDKDILILFIFIGCVPLLLTSSFLVYKNFWIFIAMFLIIKKGKKYEKS